ncbi:MAG TPA: protein kinase [Pyrinomonadaceae bacterium]|jgi:serine/threonine-protein kinase|nr:protein kinase [Pyrinomonadaceae bacterium]
MSSCFDCGSTVDPEDRFCGNCGIALGANRPAAAGAHASGPVAGEPSSPLEMSGGDGAVEQGAASVHAESTSSEQDDSEQFEPTLIESAHGGGQAAAAARAHEPVAEQGPGAERGPVEESATGAERGPVEEAPGQSSDLYNSATIVEPSQGATTGGQTPEAMQPASSSSASLPPQSADTGATDAERRQTGGLGLPSRPVAYTGRTGGSARRAASQLEPGTVLYGRYEIVKRIGGGGMGAVYYAKDKNLGEQPRAVKEMIQTHLDESQQEKAVADFKRESMLLASLEHPSIPTIYDYFYDETASRFYLVMKYISGGDCLARLRSAPGGRIDELTVADWGAQAADVLDYLHNRRPQIIYRDLKPANLMIDGNTGRVMLIDFGIARWVAPQEKGVTAVGTMGYAPPELFSGKAEPRTDIYSLGATMFHLLTGADPQDNPLLIFDFAKNSTPRQINPALSNEMEWILMRAVEYEPERRFRSAAEMRDALTQHTERLRAGAVTYGAVRGAQQQQSASTLAVERVFCGFCGKSISSEDVFCPHCGARQPIAAASASLRAARATARLVVAGTTELDATFLLNKDINTVGRTDPQSNIFPDIDLSRFDPETKISRRHARIWREGDTFLVEDLGSVNGTVVNEAVRLGPRQPRPLASGDRLRLGETTLHFLIG